MIFQTYRALARLSHCSSQSLDRYTVTSLAFSITRVGSLRPCFGSYEPIGASVPALERALFYRSYATGAVSRPKAHTGRTISAPRKKASTAKTTTPKPTAAPKGPAAKNTKAKAKPKSKPRTKAKSTKARKKPAKAKAKPRKKRKVTSEEKERLALKELKAKALTPPKGLPSGAFSVLLAEKQKEMKLSPTQAPGAGAKESSKIYRSFTPEQREHYNRIANQNKATNESKYQEWIRSYTPTQIHEANNARTLLKRRSKSKTTKWAKLRDERLVTRSSGSYIMFHTQRYRSGDFAGMKLPEAAKLIGAEWRELSESDKKSFAERAERDFARYAQEVKSVYNRDVQLKALALPANSITDNGDQELSLPIRWPDSNPTLPVDQMLPSINISGATGGRRFGSRPKDNYLWPESSGGHYYLRVQHFKDRINTREGSAAIQKALDDIDAWLKVAKKGSYTPVDHEHHWVEGTVRISIKPDNSGYLLGDLQKYMNLIATLHKTYGEYWEWSGDLIVRTRGIGLLRTVGKASFTN
ncbi:MAG: hypothetical protein Q9166_001929 [cf. Caloplaca sp. 2 TL-2023]